MTDRSMSPVIRHDTRAGSGSAAPGPTGLIAFAAAPTFALMALWTGLSGGQPDMFCMQSASPLGGMTLMYALMSAFHIAPWLKLVTGRR